MRSSVRIGCYSAFWGDTETAARQLVEAEDANLDYLVADYLAEVTMGLLARTYRATGQQKGKSKPVGYIKEFLTLVLQPLLSTILAKKITVITNAGGLDPVGLKTLIEDFAAKSGVSDQVRVAAVYGDDLMQSREDLLQSGAFHNFDPLNGSGELESMFTAQDNLLSLNAYIGAQPIAAALHASANIIVTGRCVDSAAVVGPLAYEYGWDFSRLDDARVLDLIASASLAGHILECGAQATGGNFTDWKLSAGTPHGGWSNMGYPIATFRPDGAFTVSKPKFTGGLLTPFTVAEQTLYEVLDPENYILPDVVLDLHAVTLSQTGPDTVLVSGVKGKAPTEWLKCTAVVQTGYRVAADLLVYGFDAESKGQALGQAILDRVNNIVADKPESKIPATDSKIIIIGSDHSVAPFAAKGASKEVVVRVTAKHRQKEVLEILSREVPSFGTSSAPGISMLTTGRPRVSPNFVASSSLVKRGAVTPKVLIGKGSSARQIEVPLAFLGCKEIRPAQSQAVVLAKEIKPDLTRLRGAGNILLLEVAVGRSGDKGNSSNVAIIARHPSLYPYIVDQVTPEMIFLALGHFLGDDSVIARYDIPSMHAVNFVITNSLGGGGLDSLHLDRQGKGYAQICLASIPIKVPLEILTKARF